LVKGDLFRCLDRELIGVPIRLEILRDGKPAAVQLVPKSAESVR